MENQNDDNNNNNHEYDRDNNDHDHEEERSGIGGSRWNPTKEQIEMLEKIYSSEGVRTPSAEQIQQITARLRVYGDIEGKNVFYWFQNHKARQRQKQRHERLLAAANSSANHNVNHIGRIICPPPHHHYFTNPSINAINLNARPPILPSPHSNYHYPYLPPPSVICSPYYQLPQPNPGFYNHSQHYYSSIPAAVGDHVHQEMKKRSKTITSKEVDHQSMPRGGDKVGVPHGSTLSGYCAAMMNSSKSLNYNDHGNYMGMKTLDLFPVHPTGILEHKLDGISSANDSATNSCATSSSSDTNMNEIYGNHHQQNPQFFDFFSIGHA